MDDQPLDLSKKSTSTTAYQFLSVDKQKGSEKVIASTRTLSSQEKFSKSGERSRMTSEPRNRKLVPSRRRKNANETAVSQDRITGNSVRTNRNVTTGPEINSGVKRRRDVKYPDINDKSKVIDEPDCTVRAANECISPKSSTSTDVSSSYDSPSTQRPSTNPNRVLPFICELCGKGFRYHSQYKNHVRSHTGEKPFVCELCDKRFSTSYGLARHNRMHNGQRPFLCQECNKKFADSSNLKVHMRIHSGKKPYECEICGRRFRQKFVMENHKNTHISHDLKLFKFID